MLNTIGIDTARQGNLVCSPVSSPGKKDCSSSWSARSCSNGFDPDCGSFRGISNVGQCDVTRCDYRDKHAYGKIWSNVSYNVRAINFVCRIKSDVIYYHVILFIQYFSLKCLTYFQKMKSNFFVYTSIF